MQQFKIANVLLAVEDFLADDPEVFYRLEGDASCVYDEVRGELEVSGLVDFTTYFNGVPMLKWQRYADVENVWLHIEVAGGACAIVARSLSADDADAPVVSDVGDVVEVGSCEGFGEFEIKMPAGVAMAGFAIMADEPARVRNAYYYTEVDESRIRPVKIALCTTTFRKEEFIVPNIERIKADVLGCDEPIAENFHMFVVDNGRTLDAGALSDDHVSIIPNPNVGGAGGFARGMMAALDSAEGFTHVVLMDDDVRVSSESFKRTYSLLSLVNDEYAQACLNGAMLQAECPTMQFEDVGYARRIGGYHRVKVGMDIAGQAGLVRNELLDVEHVADARVYGAWWYCCIPMELVRNNGLPMPFFVRCDDVEYGVRLNAKYMVISGICVWHASFERRFSAAVGCYQYVRNMLATMAMHDDFFDQRYFMLRIWRTFNYLVRMMDYDSAGLWLDGWEAYMEGPELIMEVDGARLMKENSAKAEKLVPLSELDPNVLAQLDYDLDWVQPAGDHEATSIKKALLTIPHDHHWAPDFALSSKPGVVATGFESFTPWRKTAMRDTLVALSFDGESGHVRTMDRKRYSELKERFGALMVRYRSEGDAVADRWRERKAELASEEFWKDYLKRMGE